MKDSHIIRAIRSTAWAILPEKLEEIIAVVEMHSAGETADPDVVAKITGGRRDRAASRSGAVMVLPLVGSIFPKANLMTEYSGGTSLDSFRSAFGVAVEDPGIKSILIDRL